MYTTINEASKYMKQKRNKCTIMAPDFKNPFPGTERTNRKSVRIQEREDHQPSSQMAMDRTLCALKAEYTVFSSIRRIYIRETVFWAIKQI